MKALFVALMTFGCSLAAPMMRTASAAKEFQTSRMDQTNTGRRHNVNSLDPSHDLTIGPASGFHPDETIQTYLQATEGKRENMEAAERQMEAGLQNKIAKDDGYAVIRQKSDESEGSQNPDDFEWVFRRWSGTEWTDSPLSQDQLAAINRVNQEASAPGSHSPHADTRSPFSASEHVTTLPIVVLLQLTDRSSGNSIIVVRPLSLQLFVHPTNAVPRHPRRPRPFGSNGYADGSENSGQGTYPGSNEDEGSK